VSRSPDVSRIEWRGHRTFLRFSETAPPREDPGRIAALSKERRSMAENVRIKELLSYIQEGRIMDAMKEFYADDVVMEEPAYGKTVGLAANLEREQNFVNSVKEFENFEAPRVAEGENVSFYQNVMDWVDVNDQEIHVEQVSVATWRDGKIVHERFYYDTGKA
jgi:ketosteroid isomerase-like protein